MLRNWMIQSQVANNGRGNVFHKHMILIWKQKLTHWNQCWSFCFIFCFLFSWSRLRRDLAGWLYSKNKMLDLHQKAPQITSKMMIMMKQTWDQSQISVYWTSTVTWKEKLKVGNTCIAIDQLCLYEAAIRLTPVRNDGWEKPSFKVSKYVPVSLFLQEIRLLKLGCIYYLVLIDLVYWNLIISMLCFIIILIGHEDPLHPVLFFFP